VRDVRYSGQLVRSLVRATSRQTPKPKVWAGCAVKRSWLNGMRNSAIQPSESMAVATSHTPSQERSSTMSS
jgi:hypothetical protein